MLKKKKNRLKSWLGTPDEKIKEKKKEKKPKKQAKEKLKKKEIIEPAKAQKQRAEQIQVIQQAPELAEEKEEAKQSFFSKLFGKKEEAEEKIEEDKAAESKEKITEEKKSFFSKIAGKFGTTTLKQENVEEIFRPLELILLENNIALEVVDKIKANLEKDLIGIEVKKDKIEQTILQSLKNSISSVLIEPPNLIEIIEKKKSIGDIYTIIFFGINGSGKTTSIAKLAHKLKKQGISCVLAAGDTFRAASIEQLKIHGERLNTPVIAHNYGSDPAAVAFDAKAYAEKHKINCVLIDTAGRMYTKENLIREMEKIIRVTKPDLKIFVAESITGNDAVEQAKTFNEAVGIDGIILTKTDVDEKGGAALSVSQVTGKPIFYLGTGQSYDDLKDFKKADIIKNLGL